MKNQIGTFVVADSSKCTGCKACELACFAAHNHKQNRVAKTVGTVSIPVTPKLFLTRLEEACMPIQCKHCEDAPCLNACAKKAIYRQDGHIIVDEAICIGCKDCMMACPFGAVVLLPAAMDGKLIAQLGCEEPKKAASKCDFCTGIEGGPACVQACPHSALRIVDPDEERLQKNIRAAESLALTNTI